MAQRALIAHQAGRLEESARLYARSAALARATLVVWPRSNLNRRPRSASCAATPRRRPSWTRGRPDDAAALLEEASDVLEGLFSSVSSPWVRP
jgi:hypothetical protein